MRVLTIGLLCAGMGVCAAQTRSTHTTQGKATALRRECAMVSGLCVTVPANWQRLGDVFGDLGFVVAEPRTGVEQDKWPQLTVAAIDVPQKDTNGEPPSLDTLLDLMLTPEHSAARPQTLERSRLTLNGHDAEMVRVKLHDATNNTDTIEQIALITGDDSFVYSIALRCAEPDFARLEAVFQKTARSWEVRQMIAKPRPDQEQEKK